MNPTWCEPSQSMLASLARLDDCGNDHDRGFHYFCHQVWKLAERAMAMCARAQGKRKRPYRWEIDDDVWLLDVASLYVVAVFAVTLRAVCRTLKDRRFRAISVWALTHNDQKVLSLYTLYYRPPRLKGPSYADNHGIEWQSLTVTLFCRPSTITGGGEACTW